MDVVGKGATEPELHEQHLQTRAHRYTTLLGQGGCKPTFFSVQQHRKAYLFMFAVEKLMKLCDAVFTETGSVFCRYDQQQTPCACPPPFWGATTKSNWTNDNVSI